MPGRSAFGGDAQGGWIDRSFATYVAPETEWSTPRVRLAAERSAVDSLEDYARANGLQKRLSDKLPPDLLDRFRKAVLVKYNGNARELITGLPKLPVPSLIHISDYVKGGFDKQYPDHLPPRASFGSPAELRELFDKAHALGHLMMPYTNPTWWCDHPRGPTFVAAGEAPLARGLDGKPYHEVYGRNDGWTTTPWHPAVQAANRTLRSQFTRDYPVDILFQDQCGARTWVYDRNPASPTPYAYAEGLALAGRRGRPREAALDRGRLRPGARRRGSALRVHLRAGARIQPELGSAVQDALSRRHLGNLPGGPDPGPRQGGDAPSRPGQVRRGSAQPVVDACPGLRHERPDLRTFPGRSTKARLAALARSRAEIDLSPATWANR